MHNVLQASLSFLRTPTTVILIASAALFSVPASALASVSCDGDLSGNGSATAVASTDFSFAGDFTIAMYLKTSEVPASYRRIMGDAGTGSLQFLYNDDFPTKFEPEGLGVLVGASTTLETNTWQDFVLVRSGTKVTLYQNGVETYSAIKSGAYPGGTPNLQICGGATAADNPYNGLMTRVVMYQSAWSTTNVTSYHSSGGCTTTASPVASWQFASSPALNTDSSAFAHTLTPRGTGAGWTYSSDEPATCGGGASTPPPLWPFFFLSIGPVIPRKRKALLEGDFDTYEY